MQLNAAYVGKPEKLDISRSNLEVMEEQVTRGSRLINNIRKLSQLDHSEIFLKPIDVCELLHLIIQYIKKSYQTKNLKININPSECHFKIKANELLEDLFENILINAITHNSNSIIEIEIKIFRERRNNKNFIKIEFIDNGNGIEDSRKKLIFQRADYQRKSTQGMGLGLSLVNKIIKNFNGRIWVEDKIIGDYTKGSKFMILLPEVNIA